MHEGAFYMQKWFILHPECTRVHFTCKSKAQMHPECTRVHFTCKSKAQMHPECTRVHFTCKNYLICTQNARECILHAKVRHKCTQNARGCILHAKVRHKMHARCTHFDNIYFCKGNSMHSKFHMAFTHFIKDLTIFWNSFGQYFSFLWFTTDFNVQLSVCSCEP